MIVGDVTRTIVFRDNQSGVTRTSVSKSVRTVLVPSATRYVIGTGAGIVPAANVTTEATFDPVATFNSAL